MIGYIFTKDQSRRRCVKVYLTVQELRLCCGEVPNDEIAVVEIKTIDHYFGGEIE